MPFQCPPGFDAIDTHSGPACAYHDHASCLGGVVDAAGHFVCTDLDFECPPDMAPRPGAPPNWCFQQESSAGQTLTGLDAWSSWSSWPSWPSWQGARADLAALLGGAGPGAYHLGKSAAEALQAASRASLPRGPRAPALPVTLPEAPAIEAQLGRSSAEIARGAKVAAAILGVAVLGAAAIWAAAKSESPVDE